MAKIRCDINWLAVGRTQRPGSLRSLRSYTERTTDMGLESRFGQKLTVLYLKQNPNCYDRGVDGRMESEMILGRLAGGWSGVHSIGSG
jgi:hypothetical protein